MSSVAIHSKDFGFNPAVVVHLRAKNGWSQERLAQRVGLTRVAIGRIESGQSEPKAETVQAFAAAFSVHPTIFYDWLLGPESVEIGPDLTVKAKTFQPLTPGRQGSDNAILSGLSSVSDVIQAITSTDNPLDYDRMLWDRSSDELQQVAPGALRTARDYLAISLADTARLSGLPVQRLSDLETGQGMPVTAEEIMKLRQGLGVAFDPRAVAYSGLSLATNLKDKRPAKVRLSESQRLWQTECQRTPNKLDTILARLDQLHREVEELKQEVRGKKQ